jgi:penicillin-insensitive murein endopeptidase
MQMESSMDRTTPLFSAFLFSVLLVGCGSGVSAGTLSQTDSPGTNRPDDGSFIDGSKAIGFYAEGALDDAAILPDEGSAHLKIFRLRRRGYATQTLVRELVIAAESVRSQFPQGDRLQIADIADANGGTLARHSSHQNGLDADVIFYRKNHYEEDPNTSGPGGFQETFVRNGKVTTNFDMVRNWTFVKNLVARGQVARIFVDAAIKKAFCDQSVALDPGIGAAARTEILRRLRPYPNHDDHYHVRLKCPKGHGKCVNQSEPSKGSGCSTASAMVAGEPVMMDADDDLGEDDL